MNAIGHRQTATAVEILALFRARATPALVDIPPISYLIVDGEGQPTDNPAWEAALEALYTVSYTIRFALKRETGLEYKVGALEALWWAEDMDAFRSAAREGWMWRVMISQPPEVTPDVLERAQEATRLKKPGVSVDAVRLEVIEEGRCAQVLHVGPYETEAATIDALHAFVRDSGLELTGKHHEIYLGDPRRSAPEKLRTVIRQPVRKP